jgi:Transcription factor WhiB
VSGRVTLWLLVTAGARCAGSGVDPDEWFPVSATAAGARQESAGALTVCAACPVRAYCLELSLRNWVIGQHGIWGGTVPAEREALRRRLIERAAS